RWLVGFEVTGALLIIAAVGALMLTHIARSKERKLGQPEWMRRRFRPGNYPGPRPGPGVYATSSSNVTPARLPDGRVAPHSVPQVLPMRELTAAELAEKETER